MGSSISVGAGETYDQAELKTLQSYGLIPAYAELVQYMRKWFGIADIKDGGSFAAYAIIALLVFGISLMFIIAIVFKIFNIFSTVATGGVAPLWKVIIFCLTIGFLVSFLTYPIFIKPFLKRVKWDLHKQVKDLFGIQGFTNQFTDNFTEYFANPVIDTSLMNLQSIAVKQAAYVGPNENEGSFDTENGIQSALKVGIRVFTLQISYLEVKKDSSKFDTSYMPTLVYRNDSGDLISSNGANIKEVAKSLAAYAFSETIQSSSQPLIIYLHFQRTPNALREPEKYVEFLSSVAQLLEPLQEFMLGPMPEGNFKRQQNESVLLTTPTSVFMKKVIVFCNADTTIFRNLKPLGLDEIDTKYDLDFIVNVRVYLDDSNDDFGATSAPLNGETVNAVIVPFKRLDDLSEDETDKFALKGKRRFVIAMPSQMKNPTVESIKKAINKCSVNCIPLNLFGDSIEGLKEKMNVWEGEPFYRVKAPNYRISSQPAPL